MEDKPSPSSCIPAVINVGSMTGEYRLSFQAIINATLMACRRVKSQLRSSQSACWGMQDPTCLPGSKENGNSLSPPGHF